MRLCVAAQTLGARSGGIKAEDAEKSGGGTDFGERGVERRGRTGFNIEVELIFERPPVDGAAFDFLEVYAVAREGFKSGEEGAGLVGKAQGKRHFVGSGRSELRRLRGRNEQNEAREVFGIVVDVFGEGGAAVDRGSAARGDTRERFIAARDDFADTAGGVFRGNALQIGMREEEFFALCKRDGMRGDGAKTG